MTAVLETVVRDVRREMADAVAGWHRVCAVADLEPGWGEAALISGRQVALFRTLSGEVFAVAQEDPATGANVMARGITGSRGDAPNDGFPVAQGGLRPRHR